MKVAIVEFTPSGGLFQFSSQFADGLAESCEVHLITGPDPELGPQHPAHHVHAVLPTWHPADAEPVGPWTRTVRRAFRAVRLVLAWVVAAIRLRRLRPDAVIWSSWRFSIDALGALAVRRLLPRAVLALVAHEPVGRVRRDTTRERRGRVLDLTMERAWACLDVVFVLGETARAAVLASRPVRGRVVVIPHGDESALRHGAPVPACRDTGPVVLFFGGWTAYKGIDLLLDAVPRTRAAVPDVRVVLAGAVLHTPPALLERAADLGVDARPGYVPVDEVPALLASARVVVVPYRRATQSGVVHLAYTFERPVVATAVGELPAVVADGGTGLLVEPGDADALADALVALLADPDRAHRLGAAGAAWLATESSWPAIGRRAHGALLAARGR
ncbi:glycosyltransferase family 4 protein [Actinomycetospora aeridis]|uniref:Glycosyltransferase family 4 protein n=1 Tax=Actinomycetospora aeridis TaxID=3129231 RepID=A0ABU8N4Q3_9PSEU